MSFNSFWNRRSGFVGLVVFLSFSFLVGSCGPLDRGEEEKGTSLGGGTSGTQNVQCPSTVSYSSDIYPMLDQKCSGCHKGSAEHSFLSGNKDKDYPKIAELAGEGELLLKPTGKVQHGGGKVIEEGSDEYVKLKCWIDAGYPNN